MSHRFLHRILIIAVLVAKLVAMDLAFMPTAHGAAQDAAPATSSHCATVATDVAAAKQHGPAHARDLPGESHQGCSSDVCKCYCAHAPAVVAAVSDAAPFVPHAHVPAFEAAPPAIGGISVVFRPPI
jgi:hypothetical protein